MSELPAEDVVSIVDFFHELEDPRSHVNRLHTLGDVLVICVLAVIAGADGPKAIGIWADAHREWLMRYLKLPNGVPSHDTIGRVLAALRPESFQACFEAWMTSVGVDKLADGPNRTPDHIAIDGKALRRSHDRRRTLGPLFLVSAWSVRRGISLGQLATEEKSNEITAIPTLLDQVEVRGAVVTIDAAGCQRNIAKTIVRHKGDYVFALKGNQEKLHAQVSEYLLGIVEEDSAVDRFEEVVKGHGRIDTLTYYHLAVPSEIDQSKHWHGLKTIGLAIRMSESRDEFRSDVRYYISSLEPDVARFASYVRGHWAIENTHHWCLDVTFREDECRVRDRHAAQNLAWLKRFAISLLKQQPSKESIAMRRRLAGWNIDYLAQVVGLSGT